MDRFDPFVKYADVYGEIINWEKDPMNKPQNQNKYFFSDGKTYYEQICKMLRLMSVFKEAFNQIYNNEDEISEAWENFVNNLSASVVEGSEPDVTLTWTDDSVNFEFTMVPGVPGDPGVGITSISFNSDYTMTITLSDGSTYTSMSLKGDTGPQGPQGETGSGLQILDVYASLADLQSAHPTGNPGDAYQVGSGGNYTLYIWSSSQSAWVQAGTLGTVSPSTSAPLMDGTASAGSQNLYSREDHVHPSDTSRASKEEMDALIKTSQALIDQSFTYRESPAIQDGLARIDKIKGNTILWNQLVANGNFADSSNWYARQSTFTVSDNIATVTPSTEGTERGMYNLAFPVKANHKYLLSCEIKPPVASTARVSFGGSINYGFDVAVQANQWNKCQGIVLNDVDRNIAFYSLIRNSLTPSQTIQFKNMMIIDLTQIGLDSITDPDEFNSLFPLPYYDYNTDTLLSFNGTGVKTTGKNLINIAEFVQRSGYTNLSVSQENNIITVSGYSAGGRFACFNVPLIVGKQYTIKLAARNNVTGVSFMQTSEKPTSWVGNGTSIGLNAPVTFTASQSWLQVVIEVSADNASVTDLQLELGSTSTSYEAYHEETLSLPISQYFPTGMKSAKTIYGEAYDELTHSKAITRMGIVDLGSLTWTYTDIEGHLRFVSSTITPNAKSSSLIANVVCAKYEAVTEGNVYNNQKVGLCIISNSRAMVYDPNYTDATAFKTAMSGVYLYYELETPTETSIDLDLSFNAYENGTEQLLPVNGSVPSTSPIIADMTYLSIDDAMEYIIEKLANVPLNTQQILESLEDDVADLQEDVGALQPAVSALQTSVRNINTNIGQLSSTVAGHTSSISDIQSDITDLNTGLSDLEDTVTDNTSRIGTLETGLSSTNGQVQNLATSVSGLDSTVTAQGTTVTALDSIISDISNNPVNLSLGNHELGFVQASVEATLPANTGTMVTIPKPTIFPNNYTPLFIVGMNTGSYNVSICAIPSTFGSGDSVTCRVWNHGSQQTTQITIFILCMRQRQSQ